MMAKSYNILSAFQLLFYTISICIILILVSYPSYLTKRSNSCPPKPPAHHETVIIPKQVDSSKETPATACQPQPKAFKYEDFKCYQFPSNVTQPIDLFEDITESKRQPTNGTSIFFFETSCAKDGLINFDVR